MYADLYVARNAFVHGNPVDFDTLLAKGPKRKVSLPQVAALLYRYALVAFIRRRYPPPIPSVRNMTRFFQDWGDDRAYDEGLLALLGLDH